MVYGHRPGPSYIIVQSIFIHSFSHSFIHSGYFYRASSSPLLLRGTTEPPQATASEGLAEGPYVVARAGFEPTTLSDKRQRIYQ